MYLPNICQSVKILSMLNRIEEKLKTRNAVKVSDLQLSAVVYLMPYRQRKDFILAML